MGQREQTILAAYAPDIVIVAETEDCHKRTTKSLIDEATWIGFVVNENQTKLMVVSEKAPPERDIGKILVFQWSP